MLQSLLNDEPNNLEAWSMSAFIALENEDYATAIKRWEKMLTLMDANSEKASMLKGSIAYAQAKMTEANNQVNPFTDENQQATEQQSTELESTVKAIGQTYHVEIDLAEHVSIPENGFLIVYAQSAAGPPMPIAALKMSLPSLSSFPIMVELSDANSMMEGVKLSDYPEFIIKARVSVDGNVNNKEGDWQGKSGKITTGKAETIKLLISEKL